MNVYSTHEPKLLTKQQPNKEFYNEETLGYNYLEEKLTNKVIGRLDREWIGIVRTEKTGLAQKLNG